MKKTDRFRYILEYFIKNQPVAETELQYRSPYELAVAVVLSAQCTDKRVNMITPHFFRRFPDAATLAAADPSAVFEHIRSCSYPNNKTKNLIAMAQVMTTRYGGSLPSDVTELQTIPGVGRKTANVLASVLFNRPVIAVDTHVFRVAARLGLSTNAKTPLLTEQQLEKHIPENFRAIAHHWLILHGRYVCLARKPKCGQCGLTPWCRHYEKAQKA